jgi:hypothetical protein
MDAEVIQRAAALAPFIEAFTSETARERASVADDDSKWAASTFAAALIEASVLLAPPLREDEAIRLVGSGRYQQLRQARLIRVVRGVVGLRRRDRNGRSSGEDPDIALLRDEATRADRHSLWLSQDSFVALHGLHAASHRHTPSLEALLSNGCQAHTHDQRHGFILEVESHNPSTWLSGAIVEAAAQFWANLLLTSNDAANDGGLLDLWLDKLRSVHNSLLDAPGRMTHANRERLLNAVTAAVLREPDAGDLSEGPEPQFADGRRTALASRSHPVRQTCAATWLFLDDFVRETHEQLFDDSLGAFHILVGLIVRYDSYARVHHGHFDRLLKLVEEGVHKPYLLYAVALSLQHSRPEAIAWLLTRITTAALGLILLVDLDLIEATMMDGWEPRTTRTHERRMALLREALPLVTRTFALAHGRGDSDSVHLVLDLLRAFARRCVRRSRVDGPSKTLDEANAEEIFAFASMHLADAQTVVTTHGEGRAAFRAKVLQDCAPGLLAALPLAFAPREPIEHLKVALELLRCWSSYPDSPTAQGHLVAAEIKPQIATMLHQRYLDALALVDRPSSFRYYSIVASFLGLPWHIGACAICEHDSTKLDSWLTLPGLISILRDAAKAQNDDRLDVIAGCAARLRTHLEVLLSVHRNTRTYAGATAATRAAIGTALEGLIERLVLARTDAVAGTVAVFDRDLVLSGDNQQLSHLISMTMEAIATFPPALRDRILDVWVDTTNDAFVLLAIDKCAVGDKRKKQLRERLAQRDVLERATNDHWVTSLLQMTQDAAAADHRELATVLLEQGNTVMADHPWRTQWERAAFRAELLLAYHRRDRAAVAQLQLPPSTHGATREAQEQQDLLERSRAFYFALLTLETDPEAARSDLAGQLAREPSSAALAVNLFAADLRIAKAIVDDVNRHKAFEAALRRWSQHLLTFPKPDELEPFGTINSFVALDGAHLDDEFDARWRLIDDASCHPDLLIVRLEQLARRGLHSEANRLRDVIEYRLGTQQRPSPAMAPDARLTTEEYRRHWNDIRALPPAELSHVIGQTSSRELTDFLLDVHTAACRSFLTKHVSIRRLAEENDINDVVVTLAAMQLRIWGWHVADQSRGGRSAGGNRAGARDWVIQSPAGEVCVCEAVRLTAVDRTKLREHLERLVNRYNPAGAQASIFLVYFEGTQFGAFVSRYREEVLALTLRGWKTREAGDWRDLGSNALRTFRLTLDKDGATVFQDHLLIELPSLSD